METVKNKKTRSYILIGIIVGLIIIATVIWAVFFMNRTYSSDATPYVDGRIETGDNAVDEAMKDFYVCPLADVIGDNTAAENTRLGIVFVGFTEEDDTNEAVLKLIKENGIKASFAVSAADGLADEEFVDNLIADDCKLISNGASGESNVHTKSAREIVETMLKSRESLSTMADVNIPIIYCSSTAMTSDILRGASVSGYDAVLNPNANNVIDENSFAAKEDAEKFLNTLKGDTIVVIDLNGLADVIQNESSITAAKPAIDMQAELDNAKEEKEEPVPILTQVQWLTEAIHSRNIATDYVDNFEKTDGMTVLKNTIDDANAELSEIYRYCLTDKKTVGIGVKGLPESGELDNVLSLLKNNSAEITFFLTADEITERKDDINKVISYGCSIGIAGKGGKNITPTEAFDEIYEGIKAMSEYQSDGARLFVPADDENLVSVRKAARLLNVKVVMPDNLTDVFAGALYMLDNTNEETLSLIKDNATAEGLRITDIKTVIDESGNIPKLSAKEISQMRRENEGKLAEKQSIVYTTERALSFVFYGAGNKNAVIDAADKIKARNESGTFFITLDELMSCQPAVEHIINDGHEIGIAYRATSDYPQGFDSVMSYINNWKKYAEWRYGIDSDIVYMPFDKPSDETEEAINVSGCQLVGNTFIVVQNDDKEITLDGVPAALEKISHMRLMRGSFVCFNMSFYDNDKYSEHGRTIFGSVLDGFINEHVDSLAYRSHDTGEIEDASRFAIKTVSEMLKSPEKYTFVNKKQNDVTIDKNVLQNLGSEDAKFDFISEHYIGTSFVTSKNKLPGFTNAEISRMDTKGRFTDDKVLFLTFDDWGTEKSLNELLYVLEKNDVKATFFVTTQYVDSNPNMLRAIAVQGHQIGCHTDGHLPLSDSVEGISNKAVTLTDEEAVALRKDVVTAYNKLYKYTGDVVVNGKQALSRMFRPPTLAVSRIGISQVFDVGYNYSVSGDMSTDDYKAESYEDMVSQLKNGITDGGDHIAVHDGSVIVMHMLENAEYTAQALDYMIPLWKEQGYTFARLDDYLK